MSLPLTLFLLKLIKDATSIVVKNDYETLCCYTYLIYILVYNKIKEIWSLVKLIIFGYIILSSHNFIRYYSNNIYLIDFKL